MKNTYSNFYRWKSFFGSLQGEVMGFGHVVGSIAGGDGIGGVLPGFRSIGLDLRRNIVVGDC